MGVSQLLDQFEGHWQLSRSIEQEHATMRGNATFSRVENDVLLYHEEGLLTLHNGHTVRCTRRYKFLAQGESLAILFNDGPDEGKTFVELAFSGEITGVLTAADKHYCGKDIYSVVYRLSLPDAYETDICVSGPNKDYRAVTRYTRG
ncbi:DUF6314 family protein [Bordetella genomosp. 4]|uniref:DUF6314 family protein n=1 Tax=Bordetella genomosp. 4 TaxID=463044 RepID=UPI000B9E4576|nr:DUF6314 family protein [Bordetella genomosp. 4]OZI44249.1 hypothetical protein CAL21_16795 [Bordetella genomosp. 4]